MDQDKKVEKKKEQIKPSFIEEETEGKECPHCHNVNEHEAKFCAECGHDFQTERICKYCGMNVQPGIDRCNYCGEWLLEGVCKFCGAEIEERQTFCGVCGNLLTGINCPQCGALSNFDFCPRCNIPLTPKAESIYEEIKVTIEETKEVKLFDNTSFKQVGEDSSGKKEILKLKTYLEKVNAKVKKKKAFIPLFSEMQKESIKKLDQKANNEIERQKEEKRKQEEEKRKKEEEERRVLLENSFVECRNEGTIYLSEDKVAITVTDENCALDDAFWLYVNNKKIGLVNHPQGGSTSYEVDFEKGINKVELRFAHD
ncbi:MAG: zinc ribbon domain-containing protein, partial [Deltaproteobacteria bacterium]|nr:zinc ribbon domain-containing protein [Deltaproteobacteria bacterium]